MAPPKQPLCARCHAVPKPPSQAYCRSCAAAYQRERRAKDPEAARASSKAYYHANPEAEKARHAAWLAKPGNREKARAGYHRWAVRNREHVRERQNARRANESPERREARLAKLRVMSRGYHLQRKYGISVKAYLALVEQQQGRCAICREEGKLVVDHDHRTIRNRALLCSTCNAGLGLFQDDPQRLRAAAEYVEKYGMKD